MTPDDSTSDEARDPQPGPERPAREADRSAGERGLFAVLAGEDLLDAARAVGQRIRRRVWQLLRARQPGSTDHEAEGRPDPRWPSP